MHADFVSIPLKSVWFRAGVCRLWSLQGRFTRGKHSRKCWKSTGEGEVDEATQIAMINDLHMKRCLDLWV